MTLCFAEPEWSGHQRLSVESQENLLGATFRLSVENVHLMEMMQKKSRPKKVSHWLFEEEVFFRPTWRGDTGATFVWRIRTLSNRC